MTSCRRLYYCRYQLWRAPLCSAAEDTHFSRGTVKGGFELSLRYTQKKKKRLKGCDKEDICGTIAFGQSQQLYIEFNFFFPNVVAVSFYTVLSDLCTKKLQIFHAIKKKEINV